MFGAEDVVVEGQVLEEAATPMNGVPGVIGEVVHDAPSIGVHSPKDVGRQGEDPGDEDELGLMAVDQLAELALEAPPFPATTIS